MHLFGQVGGSDSTLSLAVCVVDKPIDQACLTDACFTEHANFEVHYLGAILTHGHRVILFLH